MLRKTFPDCYILISLLLCVVCSFTSFVRSFVGFGLVRFVTFVRLLLHGARPARQASASTVHTPYSFLHCDRRRGSRVRERE